MKNILITLALLVSFSSFGQTAEEYYLSGNQKWKSDKYAAIDDYKKAIKYSLKTDYWRLLNSYRNIGRAYRIIAESGDMRNINGFNSYDLEQQHWYNSVFYLKKAEEYIDLCESCVGVADVYEDLSDMILRVYNKELIELLEIPKNETALSYINKAIELNPDPTYYASRAWIYWRNYNVGWPYRDTKEPNIDKACKDALKAKTLGLDWPLINDILKDCN